MKKYKITLANNEIHHVTRSWFDYWIRDMGIFSKMRMFRDGEGKKIWFNSHFTISIEEE